MTSAGSFLARLGISTSLAFMTVGMGGAAVTLAPQPALSQETVQVETIEVRGNERVENETILTFLGLETGGRVSESEVNEALEKLYDSGLFADITISSRQNKLIVTVVENPIISDVIFEGNKRIDDEELAQETSLGPRSVYSKSAIQQDVKRILTIYQRNGRFGAEVVPKIIPLEQNRVNLVYEIDEGDKSEIARIVFTGNEAFNDERLRAVLATKETRWYRILSSNDTFDPDRLEFDKELLRRFYVSEGYADFRVLSANAELTPDKSDFIITFTVEEGPRYTFGDMEVTSTVKQVDATDLQQQLTTEKGDVFDANEIENSSQILTDFLGDLGYAFVDIEPRYNKNEEDRTIGLNYIIKQGPRVYVENINISGNVRTLDRVIRREFNLAEGDPYNASQIKRSKQKIENLGFFSKTEFSNEPGSAPDRINVNVDVEEQSTGELTFGAGFSSTDGALGDISITERNLLGKGQFLKLNFTLASVRQEIDLSFTEPYFLGKDFAAGFDIFSITRDGDSARTNRTFDNETVGTVLRGAYSVTDHLRHSLRYSLRSDDITDVDELASEFIKRQEGKNTTSLVGHSLIYDKRDSRFNPRDGFFLRFNQDVAGLGGDAKFLRHEVRAGYYQPFITDDITLRLTGSLGNVTAFGGEDVRINDRFFIGQNEMRGFDNEGIGPRDDASRDPLGGNNYAIGSVEVGFPLGLPEELGVEGALFTDVGTLFGTDDDDFTDPTTGTTSRVLDESSARVSVGFGVSWSSPLGPIRIDISDAIVKEDFDETEIVRFSFGTRF